MNNLHRVHSQRPVPQITYRTRHVFSRLAVLRLLAIAVPLLVATSCQPRKSVADLVNLFTGQDTSTRAVVSHGATIGRNSVIGALGHVRHNVPEDNFCAGNPAALIKKIGILTPGTARYKGWFTGPGPAPNTT